LTETEIGVSVVGLVGGLVPEANLPAFVDEIIEGYIDTGDTKGNGYDAFYEEIGLITKIAEATGKIYINLITSGAYRWTNSLYAAIGTGLVLGENSANAYRGDYGKIAYDHSQISHDYAVSSHLHTTLDNPNENATFFIGNSLLEYSDKNAVKRIEFDDEESILRGMDGTHYVGISDTAIRMSDGINIRMFADAGDTRIISPDGLQTLKVDNTGAYYNGVEINSGSGGSGDVVGPASSIDYRVPTFHGVTGKLLRQSPVSISGTGVMLGVTSLTVGDIKTSTNVVEAIGTDKTLVLRGSGTGGMLLNDVITVSNTGIINGVAELYVGDLKLHDGVIETTTTDLDLILNPNGTGKVDVRSQLEVKSDGQVIRIVGETDATGYISWYKSNGTTRRGWLGFGSGDATIMALHNDFVDGTFTLNQSGAAGTIQVRLNNADRITVNGAGTYLKVGGNTGVFAETGASGVISPNASRFLQLTNTACSVSHACLVKLN